MNKKLNWIITGWKRSSAKSKKIILSFSLWKSISGVCPSLHVLFLKRHLKEFSKGCAYYHLSIILLYYCYNSNYSRTIAKTLSLIDQLEKWSCLLSIITIPLKLIASCSLFLAPVSIKKLLREKCYNVSMKPISYY